MIKEAIDRVIELAQPTIIKGADGLERSSRELCLIRKPIPDPLKVQTLMGVSELISNDLEALVKDDFILHVESHLKVALLALKSDEWGRRLRLVEASCADDVGKFKFGQFGDPEEFVINLQACFVPGGDIDYLIRTASNLSAESSTISSDDGISQKVQLNRGVVLKGTEVIRPRVKLAPYRTFREVDQPISDFIFRVRGGGDGRLPACGLFEADGGKWRLDAVANVARWLSANVEDIEVIS